MRKVISVIALAFLFTLALVVIGYCADAILLMIGAPVPMADSVSLGFLAFTLDAADDKVEWVVQASEAATITSLGFRYGARTGTPPVYRISMQSVGTDGRASGTILGGGSPASGTFQGPADTTWDGTFQWVTLTNSYAVARGAVFAIVIDYSSETISGSHNSSIASYMRYLAVSAGFPNLWHIDGGASTRQQSHRIVAWKSASKVFGWPVTSFPATAINSTSTPDEQALKFNIPTTWWATYKVVGVAFKARANAAATSLAVTLYTGTSALQSVTIDLDIGSVGTSTNMWTVYFDESTLSTLSAGTDYRIGFAPQESGASFYLQMITTSAAGEAAAYPGGSAFSYAYRTDAGAWTDDANTRPMVELILADITAPAGSGGASAHTFVQ